MGVVQIGIVGANPTTFVVHGDRKAEVALRPAVSRIQIMQAASPVPFSGEFPITEGDGINLVGAEINLDIASLPAAP